MSCVSQGHSAVTKSLTSDNGTSGGPFAISAAVVPGRILLETPFGRAGRGATLFCMGDLGAVWTSGNGGGEGSRGELDGDMLPGSCGIAVIAAMIEDGDFALVCVVFRAEQDRQRLLRRQRVQSSGCCTEGTSSW